MSQVKLSLLPITVLALLACFLTGCGGGGGGESVGTAASSGNNLSSVTTGSSQKTYMISEGGTEREYRTRIGDSWVYSVTATGQQASTGKTYPASGTVIKRASQGALPDGRPAMVMTVTANLVDSAGKTVLLSTYFTYYFQDPATSVYFEMGDNSGPGGSIRWLTIPIMDRDIDRSTVDTYSYSNGQVVISSYSVLGTEMITTPLGVFETRRVLVTDSFAGVEVVGTTFLSPRVGGSVRILGQASASNGDSVSIVGTLQSTTALFENPPAKVTDGSSSPVPAAVVTRSPGVVSVPPGTALTVLRSMR